MFRRYKILSLAFLVIILLLVFGHQQTQAEISVTPTLEWLADHCIESGVFVAATVNEEPGTRTYRLKLCRKETLRGQPEKLIRFDYSDHRAKGDRMPVVKNGDRFLVCLQHYTNGEKRVVHAINLTRPQVAGSEVIAVTADVQLLKDGDQILKVFQKRIKTHPKHHPVEISDYSKDNRYELDLPWDHELMRAVYAGSSCLLRLPHDLAKPSVGE